MKDYYAALGVSRSANPRGIHEAYRKLAKEWHPDRAGDRGTQKFREIQEAYEVLSDPEQRKRYDARANPSSPRHYVGAEPMVRSEYYSELSRPEPLIPRSGAAEVFTRPDEIEQFMMRFLKAFGSD